MTRAVPEAERLRRCRALFERAQAGHCSMGEARRQLAEERWSDLDRRLAAKRCGTAALEDAEGRPDPWWQR